MDDITQNDIAAAYKAVPEDVRQYLSDPQNLTTIERIGQSAGLGRVECGQLALVTSTLTIGLIKPNDFVSVLEDYLSVSRKDAAMIAQEINKEIFAPIKDSLLRVHSAANLSPAMRAITKETLPNVTLPPAQTPLMKKEGVMTQPKAVRQEPVRTPSSFVTEKPMQMKSTTPSLTFARPDDEAIDPSPRRVAAPSPLAAKLGDTYRIDPTLPKNSQPNVPHTPPTATVPPNARPDQKAQYYPPAQKVVDDMPVYTSPQVPQTIQTAKYYPPKESTQKVGVIPTQKKDTPLPHPGPQQFPGNRTLGQDPYREPPTIGTQEDVPFQVSAPPPTSTSRTPRPLEPRGPNRYSV